MSVIAGLNAYNHNSSFTLAVDGRLVYAAEEERFDRVKYSDAFPERAMADGLRRAGLAPADVDEVAFCWAPGQGARARLAYLLRRAWDPVTAFYAAGLDRLARTRRFLALDRELRARGFTRARVARVPHHAAHAASAFFTSPFERAAVLSVDGLGEWQSAWLGRGAGARLHALRDVAFPHSLGLLFDALGTYLGFRKRDDAGKVMALAALGDPARFAGLFRQLVVLDEPAGLRLDCAFFTWHRRFGYGPRPLFTPRLTRALGPPRAPGAPLEQRHYDVAAALQRRFEEAMLHLARGLGRLTGETRLCLAGGCALNCLANERIRREGPFEELFVFPAATDAGAGAGAALHQAVAGGAPRHPLHGVDLGPAWDAAACGAALAEAGVSAAQPADLAAAVADALAEGAIVGWFQGRMEFGPRALGYRSLLADPRAAEMPGRVNARVKHREAFRPFAPACPREDAAAWFDLPVPSPWMLLAARVRPEARARLPAITHRDGTARLQTVAAQDQPLFHRLLKAFGARTGVPVLLNTSFNRAGEPVVCSPADAIRCYLDTGMDALVLGPWFSRKPQAGRPAPPG